MSVAVIQPGLFAPEAIEIATTNDDLATPPDVIRPIFRMWPVVDLDPATNPFAILRAGVEWTKADDCFAQPTWAIRGPGTRIWMNPPYSAPQRFLRWLALAHWDDGAECMALVKTDHSTEWWDEAVGSAIRWCALRKRPVHYERGQQTPGGGKFCSSVIYWGLRPAAFEDAWSGMGRIFTGFRERPTWVRS